MTEAKYEYMYEDFVNDNLRCNICHEPLNDPYCTPCHHIYCKECIETWFKQQDTCPMCRKKTNKVSDLIKPETNICDAVNRLLVRCWTCGRSDIRRDQFNDHIKNQCSTITLYVKNPTSKSLVNECIEQNRQPNNELQSLKLIIKKQNDETNNKLKKQQDEIQTIKQLNTKQENKIEQLEHIIQTQKEQIQKQENFINQFQIDNELLLQNLKRHNDDSMEHENHISTLRKKIDKLISHQNPKLENDIIENCQINSKLNLSNKNLIDRDMEIVVKKGIIKRQCSSLNLRKNKITYQGVLILADTFHLNISLQKLDLSSNDLYDKGVQILAEALLTDRNLKELSLGSNLITNQGIDYLTGMLQVNETLKNLDLHGNEFNDDGMKFLTDVLCTHNQTLQVLFLHSNKSITDKSLYSIIDMFKQNRSLQRIEIHDCDFSNECKTRLQDAAENASISICL